MSKIFKYEIVVAMSIADLTKEVNSKLSTGWQPQGGICIDKSIPDQNVKVPKLFFCQAIVQEMS